MGKLEREEKIFNLLYKKTNFFTIIGREKPDFHLLHKLGHTFGVEITELFHNESSARKNVIPHYARDIIDSERYRHKDDKIYLPKTLMTIKLKEENSPKNIYGIFIEAPSLKESLGRLNNIIVKKNMSFSGYNKALHQINLIIYDNENILVNKDEKLFFEFFLFKPLAETIITSPFHEIYFITKKKDSGVGFIPLKLFHWSSSFLKFRMIYSDYFNQHSGQTANKFLKYYSMFSKYFGYSGIFIDHNQSFDFYYGNLKMSLSTKGIALAMCEEDVEYKKFKNLDHINQDFYDSKFIDFMNSYNESGYYSLFIKIQNIN